MTGKRPTGAPDGRSDSLFPEDYPALFVNGIGPPLQQIEEDACEGLTLPGTEPRQAQDTLALISEVVRLRMVLAQITEQQPKTLETFRRHGIVFDGPLGVDPKNWQHVAFSVYCDLCEVDTWARHALETE